MKGYRRSNLGPPSTSKRLTSWPIRRGRHTGPVQRLHMGLAGAPLPSTPGHGDVGFLGAKWCAGRRGSYPGRNAVGNGSKMARGAASLLWAWETVSGGSGTRRLPRGLLLLLGRFNGPNQLRLAPIWWRLEFSGFQALRAKIWAMGCAIYRVFR
jgi:hypothetical protein